MKRFKTLCSKIIFCFLLLFSGCGLSLEAQIIKNHKANKDADCVSPEFSKSFARLIDANKLKTTSVQITDSINSFSIDSLQKITSLQRDSIACELAYLWAAFNVDNFFEFLYLVNNANCSSNNEVRLKLTKRFYPEIQKALSQIKVTYVSLIPDSASINNGLMKVKVTCKKSVAKLSFEETYLICQSLGELFGNNFKNANQMMPESIKLFNDCFDHLSQLAKDAKCDYKEDIAKQFTRYQ